MILSDAILTLLTRSMLFRLLKLAVNRASVFFDGEPSFPANSAVFFNLALFSPSAECVLHRTCLLRASLLTCCGGVLTSGDDLSCFSLDGFVGVQDAGLILSVFRVGVVWVVSVLATPPSASSQLARLPSARMERRGDEWQLAAFAESACTLEIDSGHSE